MRLRDRFKAAGTAFRGPRLVGAGGSLPSVFRSLLSGTGVDYEAKAGLVYDSTVVSICVNWIWKQTQYPVLVAQKRGPSQLKYATRPFWSEIDHPFIEAVRNPVYYGYSSLMYGTVLSLAVRGNAYWLKLRSTTGAVVGFVYLPHSYVTPRNDRGNENGSRLVTYYRYTPPSSAEHIDFRPEDIIHFRWGVDPKAMGMGISPLFAMYRNIVGDNTAETLSAALLENGGIVGIAITPKAGEKAGLPVDPDKREEFIDKVRRTTTRDTAGRPLVLEFPADITTIGPEPAKMALSEVRAIHAERICGALGVDPMVVNLSSKNKTYSNYEEAIEAAYEGTVDPLLNVVLEALNDQCFRTDFQAPPDVRAWWDKSDVPAKQEDEDKMYARAVQAWRGDLLTRNEGREIVGLGPTDDGDMFYSELQIERFAQTQKLRMAEGSDEDLGDED